MVFEVAAVMIKQYALWKCLWQMVLVRKGSDHERVFLLASLL